MSALTFSEPEPLVAALNSSMVPVETRIVWCGVQEYDYSAAQVSLSIDAA